MVYPNLDRQHINERTIYYLHGLIREGSVPTDGSIVLARSEFEEAYAQESTLRTFLIPTLLEDPICFIGCRLTELREVFDVIKQQRTQRIAWLQKSNASQIKPPASYILLPYRTISRQREAPRLDEDKMADEASLYSGYGVKICRYSAPTEKDHSALRRELDRLANLRKFTTDYGWGGGDEEHER